MRRQQPHKQQQLAHRQHRHHQREIGRLFDAQQVYQGEHHVAAQRGSQHRQARQQEMPVAAQRKRNGRRRKQKLDQRGIPGHKPAPRPKRPVRIRKRPARLRNSRGELREAESERDVEHRNQQRGQQEPHRPGHRPAVVPAEILARNHQPHGDAPQVQGRQHFFQGSGRGRYAAAMRSTWVR